MSKIQARGQRPAYNDQDYPNFQGEKIQYFCPSSCEKLDTSSISHGFDDDPTIQPSKCLMILCRPLLALKPQGQKQHQSPFLSMTAAAAELHWQEVTALHHQPQHHHDIESCIRRSFFLKSTLIRDK